MAEKVGLVGGGLIGRAWAIVFARAGCDVVLYDSVEGAAEASLAVVNDLLPDLEAQDLLNGGDAATVRARMRAATGLEDALDGAVHVQESTPEILDVKQGVWRALDAAAGPDTVLASSTSGLLPSSFTEGLEGGRRCLVAHPINPPFVVPAVELVPAPWTDKAVMERTAALMRKVGQAPIVMEKEIEGFVMNRLQGALLHEAFRLVNDGVVGPEDVDIALKDGIGLRWSFMARSRPSTSMHRVGWPTMLRATSRSTPASSPARRGGSTGSVRWPTGSRPTAPSACRATSWASARYGATAA